MELRSLKELTEEFEKPLDEICFCAKVPADAAAVRKKTKLKAARTRPDRLLYGFV